MTGGKKARKKVSQAMQATQASQASQTRQVSQVRVRPSGQEATANPLQRPLTGNLPDKLREMTLGETPEVHSAARSKVRKPKPDQPTQVSTRASSSRDSHSREAPSREGSARDTTTRGSDTRSFIGPAPQLQREVGNETAAKNLPRYDEPKWGLGDERVPAGASRKASSPSQSRKSKQSTSSTSMTDASSGGLLLSEIILTDYTSITGHVTIGGRLRDGEESILKRLEGGSKEQEPTTRSGGRQLDMVLIKMVAINKIDAIDARTFTDQLSANSDVFNTRISKALETYGGLGQLCEMVQLKLFIAKYAVDRLVRAYEELGRCPGCSNPSCKRSIPFEHVAHPYSSADVIDEIADNRASLAKYQQEAGKPWDAGFLLAINQRMQEYHNLCMYDRSVQLRLSMYREKVFTDLRWTGQEVDFIEGHDDLLRDCAEATVLGAPRSKCGAAFATTRPGAASSRGFLSCPPPPGVLDEPSVVRKRAVEAVLQRIVDATGATASDNGSWNLTCDGILVATLPRSDLPPQSSTGPPSAQLSTIDGTRELRRLFQKISPRNDEERAEKATLLDVTVERNQGIKEVAAMHRGWLEKWARDPTTVPMSVREVMDRERRLLLYRFDLEREVDTVEKRLRRLMGR